MNASILEEILQQLKTLPRDKQKSVLDYTHALTHPRGTPGRQLLPFAGTILSTELASISNAIEEGCETINGNDW